MGAQAMRGWVARIVSLVCHCEVTIMGTKICLLYLSYFILPYIKIFARKTYYRNIRLLRNNNILEY